MKSNSRIRKDLFSKLTDGLVSALVLVLFSLLMALIIPVVQVLSGRPGLLIYTIIILALSVALLERSIANRYEEETQARLGMIGGILTWGVITLSNQISEQGVSSETGVIIFLLILLVTAVVWRQCPVGFKFYLAMVVTSWGGFLALEGFAFLVKGSIITGDIFTYTIYIASAMAVSSLLWIILRSRTPIQRLWTALILFECLVIILTIARSGWIHA